MSMAVSLARGKFKALRSQTTADVCIVWEHANALQLFPVFCWKAHRKPVTAENERKRESDHNGRCAVLQPSIVWNISLNLITTKLHVHLHFFLCLKKTTSTLLLSKMNESSICISIVPCWKPGTVYFCVLTALNISFYRKMHNTLPLWLYLEQKQCCCVSKHTIWFP